MNLSRKALVVLMLYGFIPLLALFSLNMTQRLIIAALISCVACTLTLAVLNPRVVYSLRKGQVAVLMAAFAVIAIALYLLSGLYFGYFDVILLGSMLLTHVIPIIAITVSTELARSRLLMQRSRTVSVISYVAFTAIYVWILPHTNSGDASSATLIILMLAAATSNLLCHYISSKYGAIPNIVYNVIILCYPYFLPMRSRMAQALLSFVRIAFPIFVLSFIYQLYKKRRRERHIRHSRVKVALSAVWLAMCIAFVSLVAGVGEYKMLVIASESMSGSVEKGDAVVYREYSDQVIKEGDVILFERGEVIIVHRVIEIETVDGEMRYYTKGDANEGADVGYITDPRVVGISAFTVKYIGYPAIWVREL